MEETKKLKKCNEQPNRKRAGDTMEQGQSMEWYSSEEIAYQNKDITSKVLAEHFKGKTFRVYGLDLPEIRTVLPTNLPAVKANELRLDNLFELADGTVALVDYESDYQEEDKIKYLNYLTGIANRYQREKKDCPTLRMIVIYTGDIERRRITDEYDIGAVKVTVEPAFLSELDSDRIFRHLKEKVEKNELLDDEELMQFIILPLSYKEKKEKEEKIHETVNLAAQIQNRSQQLFALAGILAFTDKLIDMNMADKIRRVIEMTKVGLIIEEEKRQALAKAEEEKQQALAKIEAAKQQELAKAEEEKQQELAKAEEEKQQELAKAEEEKRQALAKAEEEKQQALAKIEAAKQQELAKAEEEKQQELAKAEEEKQQELAKAQAEKQQELAKAQAEKQQELAKAQAEKQQELAKAEEEKQQELAKAEEEKQQELAKAEEEKQQELAKAEEEKQQELAKAEEEKQQELAKAEEEKQQELAKAEEEKQQALAKIEAEKRQELAKAQAEKQQELAKAEEEKQQILAKVEAEKRELVVKMIQKDYSTEEIASIISDYSQEDIEAVRKAVTLAE